MIPVGSGCVAQVHRAYLRPEVAEEVRQMQMKNGTRDLFTEDIDWKQQV